MARSTRQKISKEKDLKNIRNQPDLIDIYKTFQQIPAECKLTSKAYGTFSRIGLTLGQVTHFNRL